MKDKLRELAERWRIYGSHMTGHECAAELLAILDADGDGGAVGVVKRESLTFTANQAQALLDYFGGDSCIYRVAHYEDGIMTPAGLYAYSSDYPEDGLLYLGAEDEDSKPTPAATHPHSPDAADSGRVVDEMVLQVSRRLDKAFMVEGGSENLDWDDFVKAVREAVTPLLRAPAEQGGNEPTLEMCRAMMRAQDESDGEGPREVEMRDMYVAARQAALAQNAQGEVAFPLTEQQVRQWIDACNHEPARQVLRDYLSLRTLHAERARVPGGYVLVPRWKIERAAAIVERDGDEHGIGRDLQDMLAAPSQPEDAA